jgi:hypothetical protein
MMKLERLLALTAALFVSLWISGCAHPINMKPDLAAIRSPAAAQIDKRVGYHIPKALLEVEVTTPGGGGDKVRYFPYRDIEAGLYKALGQSFSSVTKLQEPSNTAALKADGVHYVLTPDVKTTSFSPSIFTWPPTEFSVTLSCRVVNADGATVDTVTVTGKGTAEFSEFASNFSLAAVRASNEALSALVKALTESPKLRQ